jgi:DNA-binding MarR family transcriptional regulator
MAAANQPLRCYCATLRQLARRLTRVYEAELRQAGMTPAQFELLNHLHARPRSSQSTLAGAVDADQTTLSRNLKLLVEQGWVGVGVSAQDARVAEYSLSAAGRTALRRAMPHWRRAQARVEAALPRPDAVWRALDELGEAA